MPCPLKHTGLETISHTKLLYAFFWVIPQRLNSDAKELPRRKHTTFKIWSKFEINTQNLFTYLLLVI